MHKSSGTARNILSEIKMEVESHTQHRPPGTSKGDDDLYEEEITLLADFDVCLDVDDPNLHIKVVGIDTEQPVIQVNDEVYQGTLDFAFGTNLFFEKDPKASANLDPVFENNIKDLYRYVSSTDKVLRMKRIFLTAKDKEEQVQQQEQSGVSERDSSGEEMQQPYQQQHDDRKWQVNMTYEEALNLHLPEGGTPSRPITGKLNGEELVQRHSIKGEPMEVEDSGSEDEV
uniref:Transcription factor TFIIIC triple barrel domain-containing protein n=1 Tax=Anopheles epiroticus TaxID=199890 RepID=A0A182PKD9_9DIPT